MSCMLAKPKEDSGPPGAPAECKVVVRSSLWDLPLAIIPAACACLWFWSTGRQVVAAVTVLTVGAVVFQRVFRPPEVVANAITVRKRKLVGWTSFQREELQTIEATVRWAWAAPVDDNPVTRYTFRLRDGRAAFTLAFSGANNTTGQGSRQVVDLSRFLGLQIIELT
jgi:hypothetical protein